MKGIINESTVLAFYLKEMEADKVSFLKDKPKAKMKIKELIEELEALPDIHQKIQVAKDLWKVLFEESMSFLVSDKRGYDKIFNYFDEYVNFEELIFASDSFYRDHTLHCLWVYFLGEYLYNQKEFKGVFKYIFKENEHIFNLKRMIEEDDFGGIFDPMIQIVDDFIEVMQKSDGIRCINALTHDLGYPLKKIKKINKNISNILPYFSINHFDEFNFTFTNEQKSTIESFLNSIVIQASYNFAKANDKRSEKYEKIFEVDEKGIMHGIKKDEIYKLNEDERRDFTDWFSPQVSLRKDLTKYARYSEDFENYEHGIMSAFILYKTLGFNKRYRMRYSERDKVSIGDISAKELFITSSIYNSISDHTSNSYRIKSISDPSAFLILIDEIEEFSRISRADQNRQYISEFCKSSIYMEGDIFCVDFIFDNKEILNLDPERAFKGRSKKTLSLFDITNLDEDFKMRMRCIDHISLKEQIFSLEIGNRFAKIDIDSVEQSIPRYLKSRELYTREEYAKL